MRRVVNPVVRGDRPLPGGPLDRRTARPGVHRAAERAPRCSVPVARPPPRRARCTHSPTRPGRSTSPAGHAVRVASRGRRWAGDRSAGERPGRGRGRRADRDRGIGSPARRTAPAAGPDRPPTTNSARSGARSGSTDPLLGRLSRDERLQGMELPASLYVPADGGYEATALTIGPWDRGLQHAGPPAALLLREAESARAGSTAGRPSGWPTTSSRRCRSGRSGSARPSSARGGGSSWSRR